MSGKKQKTVYREVVERYCHVIDANTIIIKTVNHDDSTVSECMNLNKCLPFGGCRNLKFKK